MHMNRMHIDGVKPPQPGSPAALHAVKISVASIINNLNLCRTPTPGGPSQTVGQAPPVFPAMNQVSDRYDRRSCMIEKVRTFVFTIQLQEELRYST